MPIQRFLDVDLQSEPVCEFLKNPNAEPYDAKFESMNGYEDTGKRKNLAYSEPSTSEILLHTAIVRNYEIYDRETGMQVSTGRTITRLDHRLNLDAYALLLVKSGISDEHRTTVEEAFKNYNPGKGDVDAVESALVLQGIPIGAYQVLLSFKLTRVAEPVLDDTHDRAFKSIARQSEQHDVRQIGRDAETCDVPDIDLDETDRTVVVQDPDRPSKGLAEIGERLGAERDCHGLEPTEHRVGTLFQYPEWKIKWVMKDVKIGHCRIVRTKLPELWTRTTKKVLYCFVLSSRDAKRLLEKVFLNCMETSAIVGGLLLLVTGGNFATALAAFKYSMETCLATKVPDSIKRCLISDLAILTDHDSWSRV